MAAHASGGRLTVYAITGALAATLPIPLLPRRILKIIRGAMAHDVCSRHSIALTPEAREVLAVPEPTTTTKLAGLTGDALTFVGSRILRRFSPFAAVYAPIKNAWETITFGHLLDRWLAVHRVDPGPGKRTRIEVEEATAIRGVLDRAAANAFRHAASAAKGAAKGEGGTTVEEHRDPIERALDAVFIAAASLPEAMTRRLDLALDELAANR